MGAQALVGGRGEEEGETQTTTVGGTKGANENERASPKARRVGQAPRTFQRGKVSPFWGGIL